MCFIKFPPPFPRYSLQYRDNT